MNIGFYSDQLCERGTSVALYDYAYYNVKLLNNKSYIFYKKNNELNKQDVIKKFEKVFKIHGLDNFDQIEEYISNYNITHLYNIKNGWNKKNLSKIAKNCIHCVFSCEYKHGDIFSSVSNYVKGNNNKYPVVPHMINLPKTNNNMRKQLNIPDNAIVIGGYGGKDSFNIKFVRQVVRKVAKNNPNIYFLFANFRKFSENINNIIYLDLIVDLYKKVEFINTTNAMLWAQSMGETFGIAIGEFSSLNKPIIATKNIEGQGNIMSFAYIDILKDKAIWYTNETDLTHILSNLKHYIKKNNDWNAYRDYTPEKVMQIFKKVYLD